MKPLLKWLSYGALILALGIPVYILLAEAFTLPLALLAIVLAVESLWLQNESK